MSTKRIYFTNVSSQGIGRIFSTLGGITVFILIARLMGPGVLGQYSYILTFLAVFAVLSDFGTQVVFSKDIAQIKESKHTYWGNFLTLRLGLSLLTMIVAIPTAYYLRRDLFPYLLIGCLSLPFLSSRFFEPLYQVHHKPWFSAYPPAIYAIVYLFLAILVFLFSRNLLSVFLAYIGSNIVYVIVAVFLAFAVLKPKFKIDGLILKRILKLSLPIGVASLFTTINSKADIFMLAYIKSDYEVGIYNAAYRFLDLTVMLAVILVNPIIPIFSDKAVNDRGSLKKSYVRIIELFAILAIPIAIIVPHISSMVVSLLFGHDFSGAAQVLNILVWVGVLAFYSLVSSALCLSIGVVKQGYWNAAVAASINIALNYFWIPKYSYIGSAWATLVSEIFLLGVCLYYVMKNIGNVFHWAKWVKIIAGNLVLYFLLNNILYGLNILLKISISLLIYFLLLNVFKLLTIKEGVYPFVSKSRNS